MNLNKDTPQSKSEKAAVRALIEASLQTHSPQKSSIPNLDSWILQKLPTSSTNPQKLKTLKIFKKPTNLFPPTLKPSTNSVRTSSSLSRSSRETHAFRIPLVPLSYPNDSKAPLPNRQKNCLKPKLRSGSSADSKPKDKYVEISDIRQALYSVILKNNLLSKFKPEEFSRVKGNKENFSFRFGKTLQKP